MFLDVELEVKKRFGKAVLKGEKKKRVGHGTTPYANGLL
jgi:hypothetical protein